MKSKLKYILILFLITIVTVSFNNLNSTTNIKVYEEIINSNSDIDDSKILQRNLNILIKNKSLNKEYLNTIFLILDAELNLKRNDSINQKSTYLFQKALNIAKQTKNDDLIIYASTNFGYYYYRFGDYNNAFKHFITSAKIIDQETNHNYILSCNLLKKNAYFFGTINDQNRNLKYLKLALNKTDTNQKLYSDILNAIAQHYITVNDLKSARIYLDKTLFYAKKNQHKIRYAKALGDIALIKKIEGDYDSAIQYLQKDIEISSQLNEDRNTTYAKILLSNIYLEKEEYKKAYHTIIDAEEFTTNKPYLNSFKNEIYTILLKISMINNNQADELKYRRILDDIKEKLAETEGESIKNKLNWELQKDNINYQLESEILKNEKETFRNKALIIISILAFLSILLTILYFRKRIKTQIFNYDNKVLKLQLQKTETELILKEKINSLATYKTYLSEKNHQISILKEEIKNIKSSDLSHFENRKGELNKILDSHLMTKENWESFKEVFKIEQFEYYNFLITNYPELTDANLRIIFLHKLGFNNSQIAQIIGITIEGVKKAKQRLRKKYNEKYFQIFSNQE